MTHRRVKKEPSFSVWVSISLSSNSGWARCHCLKPQLPFCLDHIHSWVGKSLCTGSLGFTVMTVGFHIGVRSLFTVGVQKRSRWPSHENQKEKRKIDINIFHCSPKQQNHQRKIKRRKQEEYAHYTLVISTLGRLRQENDCEFEVSQGYIKTQKACHIILGLHACNPSPWEVEVRGSGI